MPKTLRNTFQLCAFSINIFRTAPFENQEHHRYDLGYQMNNEAACPGARLAPPTCMSASDLSLMICLLSMRCRSCLMMSVSEAGSGGLTAMIGGEASADPAGGDTAPHTPPSPADRPAGTGTAWAGAGAGAGAGREAVTTRRCSAMMSAREAAAAGSGKRQTQPSRTQSYAELGRRANTTVRTGSAPISCGFSFNQLKWPHVERRTPWKTGILWPCVQFQHRDS